MNVNDSITSNEQNPVYMSKESVFDLPKVELGAGSQTTSLPGAYCENQPAGLEIESREATKSEVPLFQEIPEIPEIQEIPETHDIQENQRIADLRLENARLKQLAQYLNTYNNSLKRIIELEYSSPAQKRTLLAKLVDEYGLSRRHVCRLLNLARSTCWYRPAKQVKAQRQSSLANLAAKLEAMQ